MSNIVQGQAPIVNFLTNSNAASLNFTDTDAANHLLNNMSANAYSSYTNASNNITGLYLSSSANKALYVFQNANISNSIANVTSSNITTTNAGITDTFGLNVTASQVLRGDDLRFKITTPDSNVINESNNNLNLSEVAPTNQSYADALNDLRILNKASVLSQPSVVYSTATLQNSLGVEGKAYYYNSNSSFEPNYKNVTGYDSMASNNIVLSIDNLTANNNYTYEVVKVSTDNATFNFSSTQSGSSNVCIMTAAAVTNVLGEYLTTDLGVSPVAFYSYYGESSGCFQNGSTWSMVGSNDYSTWYLIDRRVNSGFPAYGTTVTGMNGPYAGDAYRYVRIILEQTQNNYSGGNYLNLKMYLRNISNNQISGVSYKDNSGGLTGLFRSWSMNGNNGYSQSNGLYTSGGVYSGSVSTAVGQSASSLPAVDAQASQTYVGFVGSNNYTGLLGATEMNKIYSSSLVMNLSNGANVTQALSGGNANLMVNPTFVSISNLTTPSQVNSIVFENSMSVYLTPSAVTLNSTTNLPSPNPLVITQADENLPAGHTLDNATLSFNSTNRSTVNTSNGYNLSTEVIYAVDNNSTLSSLSLENMTTASVVRTLSVMQPNTPDNPIAGNWTNSAGLNIFYNATYESGKVNLLNVSNPNAVSFMASIEQVDIGVFTVDTSNNYTGSVLLAVTGSNNFNLLVDSTHYGNSSGANITGTFRSNYLNGSFSDDLSEYDMRVILTGNDPLSNSTLSSSTSGTLTLTNNITNVYTTPGVVTFNSNATFGAVSFKDFPNTTGYVQRYTLQFPQTNEVRANDVYPESILLEAFDTDGSRLTNSLTNATMSIPLGINNWFNKTVSNANVGSTVHTTLSYTIKVDLSLSGVVDGSVTINIPISYTYDSGNKSWINNVQPGLTFSILFDSKKLTTHNVQIAALSLGPNYTGQYINLDKNQPPYEKLDLRRGPYDSIVLSSGVYYSAIVNIYPQFDQDFTNIDYYIPITKEADVSGGLVAEYVVIDDNNYVDNIAALGYKGLNQNSLISLYQSTPSQTGMTVTLITQSGVFPAQYRISSGSLSFDYIVSDDYVDNTAYLVNIQKSIVQLDAPNQVNFMMSNSTRYLLQGTDGVYVTSTNVNGASSGSLVASVSLNKDRYSASVYDGEVVATNASIPDNGVLINGATYSSFSLSTDILRGFKDSSSYTFSRGTIGYNATYGSYNQTGTLTPAGVSAPTNLILNYGLGLGFSVNLATNPLNAGTAVFTVNKTSVTATYKGVTYPSQSSTSLLLTNMVNVGSLVPWIEKLAMNNIFVPSTNSATVSLNQGYINISTSSDYASTNNSEAAATTLAAKSYTLRSTVDDNNLVAASYRIDRNQVHLLYSANNMLRPVGKTYYVTVAPVDVKITHRINGASVDVQYVLLDSASKSFNVQVNGVNARYNLNLNSLVSSLKSSPPTDSSFNYKANLFTFEGVIIGNSNWHQYFANVDITVPQSLAEGTIGYDSQYGYTFTFSQYNNSIPHVIVIYWTNAFTRPVYNSDGFNYGYSQSLRIIPTTQARFTQYELGFVLNSSNVLIPQVRKYVSSLYESELENTTDPNGFIQQINTASGSVLSFNNPTTVLNLPTQLPYKYGTASDYPEANTNTVSIASTVNLTGSNLPTYMDLVMQVKDAANVSGSVAYTNYCYNIPGDNNTVKILKVFAKDQLVIQDYAKNLSLRVGPNGRMYAGDISSYSLNLNDNLSTSSGPINGNFTPVYNSDVNLV